MRSTLKRWGTQMQHFRVQLTVVVSVIVSVAWIAESEEDDATEEGTIAGEE